MNRSGEDKRVTVANTREALAASTTVKGTVEMATDAEALAGTDQERYVNAKQVKDNYKFTVIASDVIVAASDGKVSYLVGSYTKQKEIQVNWA